MWIIFVSAVRARTQLITHHIADIDSLSRPFFRKHIGCYPWLVHIISVTAYRHNAQVNFDFGFSTHTRPQKEWKKIHNSSGVKHNSVLCWWKYTKHIWSMAYSNFLVVFCNFFFFFASKIWKSSYQYVPIFGMKQTPPHINEANMKFKSTLKLVCLVRVYF